MGTPWGVIVSLALTFSLDAPAWIGFSNWLIFGLFIYFGYSRKHSLVQRRLAKGAAGEALRR